MISLGRSSSGWIRSSVARPWIFPGPRTWASVVDEGGVSKSSVGFNLFGETMKASILVLPGDGIGPEVAAEGVRALRAVEQRWGHEFEYTEELLGGCAIDATGTSFPDATLNAAKKADAVLLGAVGGP